MGYPMRWEEVAAPPLEEQHEVEAPRPRSLSRYFRRLIALTLAGCVVLVLAVVALSRLLLDTREPSELKLEPLTSAATMTVSRPKAMRRVGYVSVSGSIGNQTTGLLKRVEVVVNLLDRDRGTLRTQSAMVESEQIGPGCFSNYQVSLPDDVHATAYRVHFRKLYGAELK